jgi:ribonuclease HI
MKVPSKVKIFTWQALHRIIPLKSILANRHIGNTGGCPICNKGPEDVSHLLFTCSVARELWTALKIIDIIDDAAQNDRSGSGVLEILLRRESNDLHGFTDFGLKEVIMIGCSYLWWLRRKRTHGEEVPSIYSCRMSILSMAANIAHATKPPAATETKWKVPIPRYVKLNVDASFHSTVCAGSIGAIIRDYKGRFLAASTSFILHTTTVSMAEALAMRDGLELAIKLGCNRLQAESDSTEVIEACNGGDRWWSEESAVFADCVDLSSSIGEVSFKHCPREANGVAHELARVAFESSSSGFWEGEPPNFIVSHLVNDVTILV